MTFSEFGRRLKENASEGTDHGAAAPLFLSGPKLPQLQVGSLPSLVDLDDGDLKHHTDFRRVYASVIENWLGQSSEYALAGKHEHHCWLVPRIIRLSNTPVGWALLPDAQFS